MIVETTIPTGGHDFMHYLSQIESIIRATQRLHCFSFTQVAKLVGPIWLVRVDIFDQFFHLFLPNANQELRGLVWVSP